MRDAETLEVAVDGPGRGAWNMAVDHALMTRARDGRPCLRLYRWEPPCLSFGRNQRARGRYRTEELRRRGADVVRRPTGGRAVYHDRELTYAVAAPAGLWGGLRDSYRRINRALARALRDLGVEAAIQEESGRGRSPGPSSRACFRDPLPGELVVDGRKLVGSAQWRDRGALLQHGSILLDDDQGIAEELRIDPAETGEEGPGRIPAASLRDCLDELPSRERMVEALRDGFAREFGLEAMELEAPADLRKRADGHLDRYRDEEWTWRR
jgi:lipoate-protein ligase A